MTIFSFLQKSDDLLRDSSVLQFPVGQEVSGIVLAVGVEVKQIKIGDRIAGKVLYYY